MRQSTSNLWYKAIPNSLDQNIRKLLMLLEDSNAVMAAAMTQVTLTGIVNRMIGSVITVMVVVMTINMMMLVMVAVRIMVMETVVVNTDGDIKGEGEKSMRPRLLSQLLQNRDLSLFQAPAEDSQFEKSRGLLFRLLVFLCLFRSSRS